MGDQFEKFIQKEREAFDVESSVSAEERWKSIDTKLNKKRFSTQWIWKAAAVIFLATTAVLFVDRFSSTSEPVISNRYEEFVQAERFYTSMISDKRKEISSYETENLSESFMLEVNRLDEMYEELKLTYRQNVNEDKLMDAMIRNLQLRIDILNQQLKILETLNSVKNEKVHNI